jgi:hypothetical protein
MLQCGGIGLPNFNDQCYKMCTLVKMSVSSSNLVVHRGQQGRASFHEQARSQMVLLQHALVQRPLRMRDAYVTSCIPHVTKDVGGLREGLFQHL